MRHKLLITLLFFGRSAAWSMGTSGFANEAVSARALGKFNCVTAQANDPSAVFFNPAGLTQLDGWNLSANDNIFDINTRRTAFTGGSEKTQTDLLHAPSVFLIYGDKSRGLAYGFGAYSPFGLETEWSDTSFARYSTTLSRLSVAMITPTVAYRLMPELQVGVGLNIAIDTNVDLRKKVDVSAINGVASADGDARQQASGHGIGFGVGLRFSPNEQHTFGVNYRSPIDLPLDGTQRLTNLSGAAAFVFGGTSYETPAHARITLPQSVTAGYAFQATPQWNLETDVQWTDWTSIDNFHVRFDDPNPTRQTILRAGIDPLHRDWRAVWSWGAGTEYVIDRNWTARAGVGYVWAAVPESSFEPALPDADRSELTLGLSRLLFTNTSLHLSYNGVFFHKRNVSNQVDAGALNGEYRTTIHAYSVGVEQRF